MPLKVSINEKRLISLLKKGLSQDEVADKLQITPRTLYNKMKEIRRKYRAKNDFHLGFLIGKNGVK